MFRLFSLLMFRLAGWRVVDNRPKDLASYIAVVAPHTSNWDFLVGLFTRSIARMGDVRFLGKRELFRPPFGALFRWLGGYPVDRSQKNQLVDQVADLFRTIPGFKIAITPEGTRSRVDHWKTGFYHIAVKAKVPLILTSMDYGTKCVTFSEPFWPTGDVDADVEAMKAHFRTVRGRNPDQGVH